MPADQFLPAIGHAVSGATGTAISTTITYPLDLVNTRLKVQRQLQKDGAVSPSEQYHGLADAFSKIFEREGGLRAFYAGLGSDVAKSVAVCLALQETFLLKKETDTKHRIVSSSFSSTPGSAPGDLKETTAVCPSGKNCP